jgi:hypothetical protein
MSADSAGTRGPNAAPPEAPRIATVRGRLPHRQLPPTPGRSDGLRPCVVSNTNPSTQASGRETARWRCSVATSSIISKHVRDRL